MFRQLGFPEPLTQTRAMERAADRLHSKYPHVNPIVRIDTPIGQSHPKNKIIVVKVLTSLGAAEAEGSRLKRIHAGKKLHVFRVHEHVDRAKRESPKLV